VVVRTVRATLDAPLPERRSAAGVVRVGHAHFRFETLSLRFPAGTPGEAVRGLLRELAAGRHGKVARAKALIDTDRGPWRFDLAFSHVADEPWRRPVAESRMVVIGEGLDAAAIRRAAGAAHEVEDLQVPGNGPVPSG
jgi:G3E family GTPase